MRIPRLAVWIICLFGLGSLAGKLSAGDAGSPPPVPAFAELYGLIRSNLTGITEEELDRAAVTGLLEELRAQAGLVTDSNQTAQTPAVPLLSKSTVFERAYGYFRIGQVASGLESELSNACQQMQATNTLKGLIVDLRFAGGQDYAAAARTADLFFRTEQVLLRWGDSVARSTSKSNALELPLVVLINGETSGAAEALAAVLREADGGLLIGSPSAGRAYVYREFPLSNGQRLRLAHGGIETGNGRKLTRRGVTPDISIVVDPEDERAYLEDPYKVLPKLLAQSKPESPAQNGLRRRNEAELVRLHEQGADFEVEPVVSGRPPAAPPAINDPALARGLDLLKGLALAQRRR